MKNKTLLLLALISLVCLNSCLKKQKAPDIPAKHTIKLSTQIDEQNETLTVTAVGDIMLGSNYSSAEDLPKNDGFDSFKNIKKHLIGDIIFGNLEGVFLDSGESAKCININKANCYVFRMPRKYASVLKDAGFNTLSLANNHISDFGSKGIKSTIKVLDSLEISHAGTLKQTYTIIEKAKFKIGFIAFTHNYNLPSILDINKAKELIVTLKQSSDIVIVSFHGGAEGAKSQNVPNKMEYLSKEKRGDVLQFAHAAIDAGADLVLGHGPHVLRALELYKKKLIVYSLGNFKTHGKINITGVSGISPIMQIQMDKQGNFIKSTVISTTQYSKADLRIDSLNCAYLKLKELTDFDFPNHHLEFKDNQVYPKRN